ncbi:cyclophilin-like domain-containing protein [Auriculariales sp. MPI-PUGE-AT-0066]|nr:cyclophilin-like domain-containing protein [Auriculariales sp. MPI-PUGE-AT-0066]
MANVYFEISVDNLPAGRISFKLWDDVVPITARNFRELATGQNGFGYQGSVIHRAIPGGDFVTGTGVGGKSIYGAKFKDENLSQKHDRPYLLSMANTGRDTNSSQFLITTAAAEWLDGKHVLFGEVVEGEALIRRIESYGNKAGVISRRVVVTRSGAL